MSAYGPAGRQSCRALQLAGTRLLRLTCSWWMGTFGPVSELKGAAVAWEGYCNTALWCVMDCAKWAKCGVFGGFGCGAGLKGM